MIEIPDWLAKLPKNAGVSLKELSIIIGISDEGLRARVKKGLYDTPKPDHMHTPTRRYDGRASWRSVRVEP